MNTTIRRGAVVVLLVFCVACGSSGPASPTETSQPAPASFPPLSGPSRIFVFDHELSYPVSNFTKKSRFVLYDNGAFVLQYTDLGIEYRGGYTQNNEDITFNWEGRSTAGSLSATAKLEGD